MNTIYPCPEKSGSSPLKIPVIILLLLILQFSTRGNALHAQTDSLEIANAAGSDMQQTRDLLVEKVQVNTSFKLLPQIDSLETGVRQLDDLTKQTLDSRLDYSFYSSLALKRMERHLFMFNIIITGIKES